MINYSKDVREMSILKIFASILAVLAGLWGLSSGQVSAQAICGDTNNDGLVDVRDACFLGEYIFRNGPPPDPFEVGDVNGDGSVNVGDASWLFRSTHESDYPSYLLCPLKDKAGETSSVHPENNPTKSGNAPFADAIDLNLVSQGGVGANDTIFAGGNYEVRIMIENSFRLYGMSMGFEVTAAGDIYWNWVDQPDGDFRNPFFTVNDASRIGVDAAVFDWAGIRTSVWTWDPGPSTIVSVATMALFEGMEMGPMEYMISMHLRTDSVEVGGPAPTFCIDTTQFGPHDGNLVYSAHDGGGLVPNTLWPSGGECWKVTYRCGDANTDGVLNVGDAVFIINHIFKDGPAPDPICAGYANSDGALNVGDAVYVITYIFNSGPPTISNCCHSFLE